MAVWTSASSSGTALYASSSSPNSVPNGTSGAARYPGDTAKGSTAPVPGSCAYARAAVDEANNGALADASAAPQASAVSGSSAAVTGSAVSASSCGLIAATSTPVPTMNTLCGFVSSLSKPASIAANSATLSPGISSL